MNILVLNVGSSSLKAALVEDHKGDKRFSLSVEKMTSTPQLHCSDGTDIALPEGAPAEVLRAAFTYLRDKLEGMSIDAIGHRIVHGGPYYDRPVRIDEEVEAKIADLADLAPLHNPVNLMGIQLAKEFFPDQQQVAVFDTAFHRTMPRRAKHYALPLVFAEEHGVRRYGFHGMSHEYVCHRTAAHLGVDIRELRMISCHLGNGCSLAAVEYGRSVETSMGMTPLEGLVMGTRSGDIDPGVLLYLQEQRGMSAEAVEQLLNRESGLAGVSGIGNDMRTILEKSFGGDRRSQLAVQLFTHRLRKYIGAYAAIMGGVDAIIFTGGIGENSPVIRHRATQRLQFLGAVIDEDQNHDINLSESHPVAEFQTANSRVKLLAVKTDEQHGIALATAGLVREEDAVNQLPPIPIAISARHCHLTRKTLDLLFGEGHELTVRKWLSQPGQFAAEETVTVVGPKNQIERVRILGPLRSVDQIEVSRTDEFFLGVDAPVRESGKVDNTPGVKLIGPAGELSLEDGLICAWRHIHMTPEDAKRFGVKDRDVVEVAVSDEERPLTFGNVLVRVSPKYKLEMHIDTDEGNAAEIESGDTGVLEHTTRTGSLVRRKL